MSWHERGMVLITLLRCRDKSVVEGWQLLGNVSNPSKLLQPTATVHAKSFIFACDTPLIHPYLTQRASERMMTAAGVDPIGKPLQQRKVVLLSTRMNDRSALNGGRRWVRGQPATINIHGCLLQHAAFHTAGRQGRATIMKFST
jgi:hypothetical protein